MVEGRLWVIDIDPDGDQPGTLFADRLWPLKRGGIVWVDVGWNATINPGMSAHKIEGEVTGKNPWFIKTDNLGTVRIRNQTDNEAGQTEEIRKIKGEGTENRVLGYVDFFGSTNCGAKIWSAYRRQHSGLTIDLAVRPGSRHCRSWIDRLEAATYANSEDRQ